MGCGPVATGRPRRFLRSGARKLAAPDPGRQLGPSRRLISEPGLKREPHNTVLGRRIVVGVHRVSVARAAPMSGHSVP